MRTTALNSAYSSSRDRNRDKFAKLKDGERIKLPCPVNPGEYIEFEMVEMPIEHLLKISSISKYNRRGKIDMQMKDVEDIFDSISHAKTNSNPFTAYGTRESMVLMEGCRRRFALSKVEGSTARILLATSVTDDQEQAYVRIADSYKAPNTVDTMLAIHGLLSDPAYASYSQRNWMALFGVSKTTIANALALMDAPKGVVALFETTSDVPVRFVLRLNETLESDLELKENFGREFKAFLKENGPESKFNESAGKEVLENILKKLQPKAANSKVPGFENVGAGITVARSKTGVTTIKLSNKVEPEKLEAIAKILEN